MNAPESAAVVRLLVYSGVPDPEWSLDDAELEALAERVARSLQGPSTEPPPPWLLGYRGFFVHVERPVGQLPTEFRVFRGTLITHDDGQESARRDDGRVEELLLEQAFRRGHGNVLVALGVELPPTTAS